METHLKHVHVICYKKIGMQGEERDGWRERGREGETNNEEEKLKFSLDKYNSHVLWGTVCLCIFVTYQA